MKVLSSKSRLFVASMIASLVLSGAALAKDASRLAHKPVHATRPPATASTPAGNINAPATDFSKVERDDDDASPGGGRLRPVMGAGGIGLGGGF